MSETWIEVKPEDVKAGDECRIDGYGVISTGRKDESYEARGIAWWTIFSAWGDGFSVVKSRDQREVHFRRSSIAEARRRVEKVEEVIHRCAQEGCTALVAPATKVYCSKHKPAETPKPEPIKAGTWQARAINKVDWVPCTCGFPHRVYRAADPGKGWSSNQRKGERRKCRKWAHKDGDLFFTLCQTADEIGFIIRPVDRRKGERRGK